jgi:transposase
VKEMRVSRFTAEFKAEAIKQVIDRGHSVVDVSKRLGVSDKSLYLWLKQAKEPKGAINSDIATLKLEVSRLKAELKRASEERDILKKAAAYFARASE